MGEFFARIWRIIKTALISAVVLVGMFIVQSIFGGLFDKDNTLTNTIGVAILASTVIAVSNWFICDLLNIEILNNVVGIVFKLLLYLVGLIIAIILQCTLISPNNSGTYVLFSGNEFMDVLILTTTMTPFVSLYFGYKASLSEEFTEEHLWLTVPFSLGGGTVLGIALSIIFSVFPGLQAQVSWLLPTLSVGALVVIMIICKSIPFVEFGYYSYRPRRSSYSSTYSKPRKSVADSTTEKDWWN